MSILKIARMGHPVLRRRAEPIADPTARDVRKLVEDMLETLNDSEGAGLAAPQVHVPKRLVIFHLPASRARREEENGETGDNGETGGEGNGDMEDMEDMEAVPMTVLINPEIEVLDDEKTTGVAGCLSLPSMIGMVPRFKRIRYKALQLDGSEIEREAKGYHARVVQHECDHLDGFLYPQRMEDLSTLAYTDEMNRNELPLGERIKAEKENQEADNDDREEADNDR